ncbi:MAG TPA: hypothetical protein VJ926_02895 [Patescibacteria group bacterium]|nr:hypothetical protein [Patescibacteria group bacterium]
MKYLISLLMLFCVTSAFSQEIKPLLIGGAGQMYNNNYDRGHYYYGYFDYKPIQNSMGNTALGAYAKYNYWRGIYGGQRMEEINSLGAGLSFGFIPNYFLSYDVYNNISLGYRESKHLSWTSVEELPDVRKKFVDITMYSHLMDEYSLFFFRHKIFIDISYNIDSSFVNENLRIKFEESVYNFYVGKELNLAPKIILGYTSSTWHNFYEIGLGVDLFSKWFVNIVDLSLVYRYDPDIEQKSYVELSAGVDIFNLFNN